MDKNKLESNKFNLPNKKYDIILCDPPWDYYGDQNGMASAGKHYNLMSNEEMYKIDIQSISKKNTILFMWATCPKLDKAVDLMNNWGFNFRGVPFVWIKTTKDGTPMGACGVRPTITKPLVEFVIAGSIIKTGRPIQILDETIRQTVFRPRTNIHSEKPLEIQIRIEQLYGYNTSKIELFSRKEIKGWDSWWNETGKLNCDCEEN